eukprot:scaffold6555_cov62-Isochrysis_galbana.AAC.1
MLACGGGGRREGLKRAGVKRVWWAKAPGRWSWSVKGAEGSRFLHTVKNWNETPSASTLPPAVSAVQ